MKTHVGKLTGLKTGDRVRVVKEYHCASKPWPITVGLEGELGCFYRIQDGVEMWQLWIDTDPEPTHYFGNSKSYMAACCSANIEKL